MHDAIMDYFRNHARSFPRRETTNPYHILVSEVMLQQTQASRVIEPFTRFIRTLPTLQDLAHTDRWTLLGLWTGLGFNRRGLKLQRCARDILTHHQGVLPNNPSILITLPWIGKYSAHSLPIFAYNADVVTVDINITRVYHYRCRKFWLIDEQTRLTPNIIRTLATQCLPRWQSRLWHNALMDYGAHIATAKIVGITAPKQKPFGGSVREVRGYILKHLTKQKNEPLTASVLQLRFPDHDCQAILDALVQEGMISVIDWVYSV